MTLSELKAARREAWRTLMRRFVGRGQYISYEDLHERTGISKKTLYSIGAGDHRPTDDQQTAILHCLPKAALDELLRPLGYTAHPIEGEGCPRKTTTALAATLHKLAEALEDNRVTHTERAEIVPKAERAYSELGRWLNDTSNDCVRLEIVGTINGDEKPKGAA